ncbi:MAG: hypothetical protein H0U67_11880 [Gemmatimonadetes bacterium]|nr:hypothetical protein [Gemmatimonadota bacterium]
MYTLSYLLACLVSNAAPVCVLRIVSRKAERPKGGGIQRICGNLSLRQRRGDQDIGIFAQVVQVHGRSL